MQGREEEVEEEEGKDYGNSNKRDGCSYPETLAD